MGAKHSRMMRNLDLTEKGIETDREEIRTEDL